MIIPRIPPTMPINGGKIAFEIAWPTEEVPGSSLPTSKCPTINPAPNPTEPPRPPRTGREVVEHAVSMQEMISQ
jgi:hypothetical protein